MITKMRPRYYCEHCKKGSGSPSYMKRHERGCTNNPNRICGLCKHVDLEQQPLSEMVSALGVGDAEGLKELRAFVSNCPACILAAIRASKLQRPYVDELDKGFSIEYNFKDELKSWWADHNEMKMDYNAY